MKGGAKFDEVAKEFSEDKARAGKCLLQTLYCLLMCMFRWRIGMENERRPGPYFRGGCLQSRSQHYGKSEIRGSQNRIWVSYYNGRGPEVKSGGEKFAESGAWNPYNDPTYHASILTCSTSDLMPICQFNCPLSCILSRLHRKETLSNGQISIRRK